MNKNGVFIIALVFLVAGFILGFLLSKDSFTSRNQFCQWMAKKYLEDFIAKETGGEGKEWNYGVDIETDMYKLCTLELNENSLSNFRSVVTEKYGGR